MATLLPFGFLGATDPFRELRRLQNETAEQHVIAETEPIGLYQRCLSHRHVD
jgi:hypothetical protein